MGMFARYEEIVYGYDGPGCELCRGTGWLESAWCLEPGHSHGVKVRMVKEERVVDACTFPCPCGYEPDEEDAPEPEIVNWHPDEDWTPSYFQLQEELVGRGITELTARERFHKLLQQDTLDRVAHPGWVTSDEPIVGWCDEAEAVATVPRWLKGEVVDVERGYSTTVRYTFLTSTLTVTFDLLERDKLRFAYPWDNAYTARELMS